MTTSNILASAATSASYNMVLQLMFRLLTFVLNAVILRYISRDLLGVVNVRLTLLYSTTLFIAREAFRRACLSHSKGKDWQQTVNLVWLTVPLSAVIAGVLSYVWLYLIEQPDPGVVPYYSLGVAAFSLSTVIEMLAEPLWVAGQCLLYVKTRVVIEGAALAVRCVLAVSLILWLPGLGILAFSISQVTASILYIVMYYGYFTFIIQKHGYKDDFPFHSISSLFFKSIPGKSWFSEDLAKLTLSFFKQGFLKQLLTEGEKYVMTMFSVLSFGDQGVYDIINNLGSLAARFIFLPIEDSGYLFFSQSLNRGFPPNKQSKDSITLATVVLETLLKVVTLIGGIILVFGYSYSELLLDLYGGSMLSSGTGPMLLRWYCVYVLLLAINGTTECFVFATMSNEQVDKYNNKMLLFSLIFLLSSWFLTTHLGSVGFIMANCLNMTARISHSIYYTIQYYKLTEFAPLQGILPSKLTSAAFITAFIVTAISESMLCCSQGVVNRLLHITIGGICLLFVLLSIYVSEQKVVSFIKTEYKKRHMKTEEKKQ